MKTASVNKSPSATNSRLNLWQRVTATNPANYNKPRIDNAPYIVKLFGLDIRNVSKTQAVNWMTTKANPLGPKVGFFVNAHSINLAVEHAEFNHQLNQADALFADGSGMRMAARHTNYQLQDNVNGTDVLPLLCQQCINHQRSIYLLGAAPGVAREMRDNLIRDFPKLSITGVHHGFINDSDNQQVINAINDSHCDVLLVAMGSPLQERWINQHKDKLQCRTVLAVGGLFDFFSGNIPRAPLWLRSLGGEWLWRLMQEPRVKFKRYVVGNPLFLFRTYVLGLAKKGA